MSATAEKTTSMTALKTSSAPPDVQNLPMITVGFNTLQGFELTQRVAKVFASSSIVPDNFQGNLANCCIALDMANRLGASPLMVMQNLDVIYGRPAWRSKFLIASFNQCGRFTTMQYEFGGKEGTDSWSCVAHAIEKLSGREIRGPKISISLAKEEGWYDRKGSKWKTIPQLMLMYRAGGWLVNTYAPEISMGLNTEEEMRDVFDARQDGNGRFEVDLDMLRNASTTAHKPPAEGFDLTAALAAIAAAPTVPALNELMKQLDAQTEAAGIDFPVELEGAEKDRRAALDQKL